ncbi:MAG TPA: hypothetical protein VIL20_08125 [Sandaracinaceae bacterium]
MRTKSMMAVLGAAMAIGCGGASRAASGEPLAYTTAPGASEVAPPAGGERSAELEPAPAGAANELPPPPWSEGPIASDRAPAPILMAWARAENRAECAPIAPHRLGAGEGARARVAELEGGWAVEFDRPGMPGLTRDGRICDRCGRGVFGIAGTAMTPEELAGEESDVPPPTFADGSSLTIEPPAEGEQVAAATLTLRGQDCVYQVWSFLGEEHLRELVSSLRLVEVPEGPARVAAAR